MIISCILLPSLVSASTTITDTSIETTGNITIGQKITFALGATLDNIVDGWIRITGNLNVTGNTTISGTSLKVNNTEVCLVDGTNCQLSPMGEIYIENSTITTTIPGADTWILINGSWTGNPNSMRFQNSSSGNLTYTGNETMFFHIAFTISFKNSVNNRIVRASIFKNGVILPGSQIQNKIATGGDVGSTAIHVAASLSNGDYLNTYVLDEGGSSQITVTYANLFAMGMRMG